MSAADLIKSTLDYAALAYAPPPFALVKGEVRRTKGYVVVMRTMVTTTRPFNVYMGPDTMGGNTGRPRKLHSGVPIVVGSRLFARATTSHLKVTTHRSVLSRDSAEALFAAVCADLRHGGALVRKWCETLPFQVILGKTTRALARKDPPDYTPTIYASGPRWIPTKERPADETP